MSESVLLRIRPPRLGEFTLLSFENLLEALDSEDPFSLETVGEHSGASMLIRSKQPERVANLIRSHYPDAVVEYLSTEEDPLTLQEGEVAWARTLTPEGSEWLPLKVYDDTRVLEHGSDPLIDILGGVLSDLRPRERLLSRLMLTQKPHDWSEAWRERAMSGSGSENQQAAEEARLQQMVGSKSSGTSGGEGDSSFFVTLLGVGLILGIVGWALWALWQSDLQALLIPIVIVTIGGIGLTMWGLRRFGIWGSTDKQTYYDPDQVALRVSGAAFTLEVQLLVYMQGEDSEERAQELMQAIVGVYRGFDNPLGCRFAVGKMHAIEHAQDLLSSLTKVRSTGVVGVREVAALWHMPGESARILGLIRSGSRRLPLPAEMESGTPVGFDDSVDGGSKMVHLPDASMRRHHLYVARTQMGKSTLMCHVVKHRMIDKVLKKNNDAIVVVDPHADLVGAILEGVPEDMGHLVRLIDLGDEERSCGINLLDTRAFLDRDSAVDTIIQVAQNLWENWGSRMQAILEYSLKSLYEANRTLERDKQYTLLDARLMLTDEEYRNDVLRKVNDPYLLDWWQHDFGSWRPEYLADALAPVQTRLAYYAGSAVARRIIGQRQCTLDIREVIRQGHVLLVSTDQGKVGQFVAALVGAALLNLVETLVRQQGELPASERRGAMVVVDEMQSIPGVRYEEMLAQLGKFGGVLVLATQSLSKLDELSLTMRDTLLANIGCLCVFQVNAVDAARLLPEIDGEHLDEEDIIALPPHHCYGRVNLGGIRPAYFSMELMRPLQGSPEVAAAIREASDAYTRRRADVEAEQAQYMDDQVQLFRTSLNSDRIDPGMDFGQNIDHNGRNGRGRRRRPNSNGTTEQQ